MLKKINPKLVVMSMSAFGSQSVNRDCRAYGSTLEQGSGLPSVVGRDGWAPTMSHTAFGDAIGGLNGCVVVLTALIHSQMGVLAPDLQAMRADEAWNTSFPNPTAPFSSPNSAGAL